MLNRFIKGLIFPTTFKGESWFNDHTFYKGFSVPTTQLPNYAILSDVRMCALISVATKRV